MFWPFSRNPAAPTRAASPTPPVRTRTATRRYDGAQNSDLFHGWGVSNTTADAILWSDLSRLRARSRDIMRNNPYAKRFKRMVVSNVIGSQGIRYQAKVTDPSGATDTLANTKIETGWKEWARRCDVTGKMSIRQLSEIALSNVVADGEVLIRKYFGRGRFGLELQLLEIDHLPENFNDTRRNIRMGIEHDDLGRPVAYWLYKHHPGEASAALSQELIRVPAEEIIHLYRPDRISQTRGVPWVHASMTNLKMAGGYEEAELVAARLGAAKGGFYKRPADEPYVGDDKDAETNDPIQEITPGMYETLPEGWDFVPFDPTHPTSAFSDFNKAILRGIASGFDVAYNSLANDLEGVNFSSIRAGVLDERDVWMMLQSWVIESFMDDVADEWLRMALLTQAVALPLSKLDKFRARQWMPRRWPWVDPQRDMTANILAIKARLKAPSMVAAEMGYDLEEVYSAIERDAKLREDKGITDIGDAEILHLLAQINQGDDHA